MPKRRPEHQPLRTCAVCRDVHPKRSMTRLVRRIDGSVAVESRQGGVDAKGAAVGQRGARIQAIVAELNGEKVDVVLWNEDPAQFVAEALSPAEVLNVRIDEEHKIANVVVPERQLSLAIGKEGQNARLAAKLTGWRIDIRSDAGVAAAAGGDEGHAPTEAPADAEAKA